MTIRKNRLNFAPELSLSGSVGKSLKSSRSIERKDYVGISKLDVNDVLLKKLSDCLKKSISNILGVQLKSSRFL